MLYPENIPKERSDVLSVTSHSCMYVVVEEYIHFNSTNVLICHCQFHATLLEFLPWK